MCFRGYDAESSRHLFVASNFVVQVWYNVFRWLGWILVHVSTFGLFVLFFSSPRGGVRVRKYLIWIWHSIVWSNWLIWLFSLLGNVFLVRPPGIFVPTTSEPNLFCVGANSEFEPGRCVYCSLAEFRSSPQVSASGLICGWLLEPCAVDYLYMVFVPIFLLIPSFYYSVYCLVS